MTTLQQKQVTKSAIIVASIILFCSLLPRLVSSIGFPHSRTLNITSFLLFPHEILGGFKYLLAVWTGSYQFASLPLFSILFAIFLFIAAMQFRNRQNKRPLAVACVILLLSILISIPGTINGYQQLVVAYNKYKPASNNGILGLIDDFTAVQKPSLVLLIAQLAILALYMGWAIWVLNRLYAAKYK